MKAIMTRKKKNDKGFSLIELIIASAILVILTGLLAPNILRYVEKSREAKDMQTLDTVYEAAQIALTEENLTIANNYYNDGATLPETLTADKEDATTKTLEGQMALTLGSQKLSLVSKACKGKSIKLQVNVKDNAVKVWVADGSDIVKSSDGRLFQVPADTPADTK